MATPHRDVMKGPNIVMDCNRNGSHYQRGGEKTERRQEQPLAPRFGELVLIDPLQPGTRNDGGETAENHCEHDRQKPKTPVSPEHLFRSWHDAKAHHYQLSHQLCVSVPRSRSGSTFRPASISRAMESAVLAICPAFKKVDLVIAFQWSSPVVVNNWLFHTLHPMPPRL